MPNDEQTSQPFSGFSSPNYTQVPDELFDQLMPDLSDPELRVVLYIIRRTFGFKRDQDNISLSQMVSGITTSDGRVLDRGTGLSKATVARSLKSLRQKGIIKATRNRSAEKGNEPTTYRLRFQGEAADGEEKSEAEAPENTLVSPVRQGGLSQQRDTPLSQQRDTQYTGIQETDISKIRKAHAEKLDANGGEAVTAANPSVSDQSGSQSIRGSEPSGNAPSAPVAAPGASNGPTGHSGPYRMQTPVLDDSVAPGGPSRAASGAEGEGFRRLRAQAMKLRGELGHPPAGTNGTTPEPSAGPLAELLPLRRGRPPGSRDERDLVTAYLRDFRLFLGDEAPLASSVTRAINIFKAGKIPMARWADLLCEANSITKANTQQIRKKPGEGANGFAAKNRAPYYFAVLEDLCGLREQSDSPLPSTG
jgi:DNA-binding transcriptional ArsR family regulator